MASVWVCLAGGEKDPIFQNCNKDQFVLFLMAVGQKGSFDKAHQREATTSDAWKSLKVPG